MWLTHCSIRLAWSGAITKLHVGTMHHTCNEDALLSNGSYILLDDDLAKVQILHTFTAHPP